MYVLVASQDLLHRAGKGADLLWTKGLFSCVTVFCTSQGERYNQILRASLVNVHMQRCLLNNWSMNFIRTSYSLLGEQQSIPCGPQINILLLFGSSRSLFSSLLLLYSSVDPTCYLIGLLASTQSRLFFTNMIKVCLCVCLKLYKWYKYLFYMDKPLIEKWAICHHF